MDGEDQVVQRGPLAFSEHRTILEQNASSPNPYTHPSVDVGDFGTKLNIF